jgi:hypothetical protein
MKEFHIEKIAIIYYFDSCKIVTPNRHIYRLDMHFFAYYGYAGLYLSVEL